MSSFVNLVKDGRSYHFLLHDYDEAQGGGRLNQASTLKKLQLATLEFKYEGVPDFVPVSFDTDGFSYERMLAGTTFEVSGQAAAASQAGGSLPGGIAVQADAAATAYIQRIKRAAAPSVLDPKMEQMATDAAGMPTPYVQNWRPPYVAAAVGIPPALAHPAFGKFVDMWHDPNYTLSKEDAAFVLELCKESSKYVDQGANLEVAIHQIFNKLFSPYTMYKTSPVRGSRMKTDGAIVDDDVSPDEAAWMAKVSEVKDDIGTSGDPSFQGVGYYSKFWADRCQQPLFKHTCCPTVLVEVAGPHIRVSALSWVSKVSIAPLTPLMHTLLLSHDPKHMLDVARLLSALRQTVAELCQWYKSTKRSLHGQQQGGLASRGQDAAAVERDPALTQGLPYPLHTGYSNVTPLPIGQHVYRATQVASGRTVVVKFAQQYNEQVHRAWAEAGLAPQLLLCEVLPGGWKMLVMESLEVADGWRMLCEVEGEADQRGAAKAAAAALQVAHRLRVRAGRSVNFSVHGDMRADANVMYRPSPDAPHGWEVRFIDFENAGLEGKGVYPPFMSPTIQWPSGVRHGAVLKRAHDVELLQRTLAAVGAVAVAPQQEPVQPGPQHSSDAVGGETQAGSRSSRGRNADGRRGSARSSRPVQALPSRPIVPQRARVLAGCARLMVVHPLRPQRCLAGRWLG